MEHVTHLSLDVHKAPWQRCDLASRSRETGHPEHSGSSTLTRTA